MENKLPITRLNKFFSQDDFDLNIQIGEEYLHGDLNMYLVLYQIDAARSDTDEVYAETGTDQLKFLPPVEFRGLVQIATAETKMYKSGLLRFLEPGNMMISVYLNELVALGIDIRFGDYIGYPESEDKIRFYTVSNDGKVLADGKHKMFGYKPHYRTITCVPTQDNEFRGV